MTSTSLADRLDGVEQLCLPVWVFDFERARIAWANRAAIELWRAPSLAELLTRDYSDSSPATRSRNAGHLLRLRENRGTYIEQSFTFYPRGEPMNLRCVMSAIDLDDGRVALLIEGHLRTGPQEPSVLRSYEAMRHVSAMVALLDPESAVLVRNPAAEQAFGMSSAPAEWFEDASVIARIQQVAETNEALHEELIARTSQGPRWHAVEARRTSDPVTGRHAIVVHQLDVTEQREREAVIVAQQRQILELSAPLLDVAEGVIAVPIVAALTEARSLELARRLLPAVIARAARLVVFDMTGAMAGEDDGLAEFQRLLRAVRLLGARPLVTGVRPELATELVKSGAQLSDVPMMSSLREALASEVPQRPR